MFKANELENLSMLMDEPMKELENRIMVDIVRRIKINSEITRSADWQINRLRELGISKLEIKQAIQDSLKYSDKDMLELYKGILKSGYERDKEIYLKSGLMQVPFEENDSLQKLISAVSEQTDSDMKNITQSLGFAVRQPNGKLRFQPIADYYQKTLDGAIYDIASGAFDYNTELKRVVSEMTNSGLRTVDYATGWSNRVDVAARRAVMTGMSQLTSKVNEDNARQLGTDHFEVSWHSGARPTHQIWQGKVYSREELETVCGLGTVTGLCGANCYHDYFPFIPGVSERTYTDKQLAQMNAEENIKREFGGKQYTKYEALQRQRRLETTMRAQRQQINLLKEGNASEDDIITARGRYRVTSAEYARFSKAMDLPQQRERVTVDGLGNIGVGKYKKAVDKSGESGIIRLNRKVNRKDKNTGAFSNLQIPMQKRAVLRICKNYNFDTNGLTFKIQRSEKMLALPFYGSADYNYIGRIDLLPNAFTDEEQLMRTIIHEKCHVLQLKKYGKKHVQKNIREMEKQAYRFERLYYTILKKRV